MGTSEATEQERRVVLQAARCMAELGVGHPIFARAAEGRQAVDYRADAVGYNMALVRWRADHARRQVEALLPGRKETHDVLHRASRETRFLFDDLVFNSCSLFDYTGVFIGLLLSEDHNAKFRWRNRYGLYGLAKGAGPDWLAGSPVADFIVQATESWVGKLFDARATVIHDRTERPQAQFSISLTRKDGSGAFRSSREIGTYLPSSYAVVVGCRASGLGKVRLEDAAEILARRVFETVAEALELTAEQLAGRRTHQET